MNQKLVKLPMGFEEALKRLAQTPKASIDKREKTKASKSPPRLGRRKAA